MTKISKKKESIKIAVTRNNTVTWWGYLPCSLAENYCLHTFSSKLILKIEVTRVTVCVWNQSIVGWWLKSHMVSINRLMVKPILNNIYAVFVSLRITKILILDFLRSSPPQQNDSRKLGNIQTFFLAGFIIQRLSFFERI